MCASPCWRARSDRHHAHSSRRALYIAARFPSEFLLAHFYVHRTELCQFPPLRLGSASAPAPASAPASASVSASRLRLSSLPFASAFASALHRALCARLQHLAQLVCWCQYDTSTHCFTRPWIPRHSHSLSSPAIPCDANSQLIN